MSGGGKGSKQQTSTVSSEPPAYLRPYLQDLAGQGAALSQQNIPSGPSGLTQQAIQQLGSPNALENLAKTRLSGLLNGQIDLGPVGGQYLQPQELQIGPQSYNPASMDELRSQISALARGATPGVRSQQAAIGGSGGAAGDALIAREYGDATARVFGDEQSRSLQNQGQILSRFGQERGLEADRLARERALQVNRYGDERNLTTNASLQAAQLAPSLSNAATQRLLQAGQLQEYYQQQPYNLRSQQLQDYAGILGTVPFGQNQQSSSPLYRNRAASATGGALSGAVVGSAVPGLGTGLGAGLGLIGGLF